MFITQGMKLEDLREILEQREAFRYRRELHESELMKTMGMFAPAFGMVGTLIGLVFMLFGMGSSDDGIGNIGPSMGVALITTFYGTILANLIFNPFAEKIKSRFYCFVIYHDSGHYCHRQHFFFIIIRFT